MVSPAAEGLGDSDPAWGLESSEPSPLEAELLDLLTPAQLQDYLRGADPKEIVRITGETLDAFLSRHGVNDFSLPWSTLSAGGGSSVGGAFQLHGTVGQPDASPADMVGGAFTLAGGFWAYRPMPTVDPCTGADVIFCDGFESGDLSLWIVRP
ncbi:MAG: hypothetical protein AAFY88_19075 [Acidobacteriota bacterium]